MVDSNFYNINWIMWPFHSKCQWHAIVFRRKPQLFRVHQSRSGLGCADFWVYMPWLSHEQPCFYHRKFPTFSPKAMVSYLWTYSISSFLGSIFSCKHWSSIITFSKYSLTTFTWIRYHYLYLSLIFQSTCHCLQSFFNSMQIPCHIHFCVHEVNHYILHIENAL